MYGESWMIWSLVSWITSKQSLPMISTRFPRKTHSYFHQSSQRLFQWWLIIFNEANGITSANLSLLGVESWEFHQICTRIVRHADEFWISKRGLIGTGTVGTAGTLVSGTAIQMIQFKAFPAIQIVYCPSRR